MSEGVVVGDAVVVDPRVLFGYRNHLCRDPEASFCLDCDRVGDAGSDSADAWDALGLPLGAFGFGQGDGLAVEGEGEAVEGVVPRGCFAGAEEELVASEEDSDGLDPDEVSPHARVSLADEVSVDVEVAVREEAEIAVFLAMEVKSYAVAADEARVLTHCSGLVTLCVSSSVKQIRQK